MTDKAIYCLSEYGRQVTIETWRSLGGCGAPNNTQAVISSIKTLGEIEDECPFTGRSFARYAVERMNMPCFAKPYRKIVSDKRIYRISQTNT